MREAFYKRHAQRTTPKFSLVKYPRKRGTPKLAEYEGVCKRMLLDSHDDSSTDNEETPTEMTRRQQQNVLILERRLHEKTQDSYSESDLRTIMCLVAISQKQAIFFVRLAKVVNRVN